MQRLLRRIDGTRSPTEVHDHIRATVATLHKTVDSAMALKELEAALSRVAPVVDMVVADEPKAAVAPPEGQRETSEPEQQSLPMLTLVPK